MPRRALLVLPALLLVAVVALSLRAARARGTLDQSNTAAAPSNLAVQSGLSDAVYQVFTAGISGPLDTATLALDTAFPGISATVALYSVDGTGQVQTLLASTVVAVNAFAQRPQATNPALYTIASFAAPATLVAGQRYALVLENVQPIPFDVLWLGKSPAAYAGGHAFYCVNFPTTPCSTGNTALDFQTFVTQLATATPSPTPIAAPATNGANIVYALTVTTTGCGTTTPGGQILTNGLQSVVVTAVPCPGSRFTGWTGGPCNGTTINPCDFPPLATPVMANFSP